VVTDTRKNEGENSRTIFAVGYPKSGSTWLARLLGELTGSPVLGYYRRRKGTLKDLSVDGLHKAETSREVIYKSHGRIESVLKDASPEDVVVVIRDPRDVVVSAFHYCYRMKYQRTNAVSCLDEIIRQMASGRFFIKAVQEASWRDHTTGWLESEALCVRYEDLLDEPKCVCEEILAHLGIGREESQILRAIEKKSFEREKADLDGRGKFRGQGFMHEGKSGQYVGFLSPSQQKAVIASFGDVMKKLGYQID